MKGLFLLFVFLSLNTKISLTAQEIFRENSNNFPFDDLTNRAHLFKPQNGHNFDQSYSFGKELQDFVGKSIVPDFFQKWLRNATFQREFSQNSRISPFQGLAISPQCASHLSAFANEISKILDNDPTTNIFTAEPWAVQMIDSWGKIPEGILSGHLNMYGDWDECVNAHAEFPDTDKSSFEGQYCWTYITPSQAPPPDETTTTTEGPQSPPPPGRKNINSRSSSLFPNEKYTVQNLIDNFRTPVATVLAPSTALCFPSTCSMEEIQIVVSDMFQKVPTLGAVAPQVAYCNTKAHKALDKGDKAMVGVLITLAVFIAIGTVLDTLLLLKDGFPEIRKNTFVKIILAFSLVTNIRKWQDTSTDGGFGCIHGIRFFSTLWVLLGHTLSAYAYPPSWNSIDINQVFDRNWSFYLILNGYFSVDSFYTMSGLLAALSILKAFQKTKGYFSEIVLIFKLYIHRYLRLTPAYALVIGILATLYPYVGNGPAWNMDSSTKLCRKFWWHNLLYINTVYPYNYEKGENYCGGNTWYIANDMFFFLLSPLFIYPITKWKWPGLGLMGAATVASILAPAIVTGTEKAAPTLIFWKQTMAQGEVYGRPQHRIAPYLVGMWTGYLLFKLGKKPVKLHPIVVIGGWLASTGTALACIFGIIPFFYPDNDDNYVASGFYAGLARFAWGMVICWVIFACVKGYGGWVNSLLSLKVFIPLGRLTFLVYLSSAYVQMVTHYRVRQPPVFDTYSFTNTFFSHIIFTFLVGFVLTMTFESPFIILAKMLLEGVFGSSSGQGPQVNQKNPADGEANRNGEINGQVQPGGPDKAYVMSIPRVDISSGGGGAKGEKVY